MQQHDELDAERVDTKRRTQAVIPSERSESRDLHLLRATQEVAV